MSQVLNAKDMISCTLNILPKPDIFPPPSYWQSLASWLELLWEHFGHTCHVDSRLIIFKPLVSEAQLLESYTLSETLFPHAIPSKDLFDTADADLFLIM